MNPYAAYVALGPGEAELYRLADLSHSLFTCEPALPCFIVIDDGRHGSAIRQAVGDLGSCELVVLPHPRSSADLNRYGGLCTSNLLAMRYSLENIKPSFLLKLDTDALVIRPFAAAIRNRLSVRPDVGILGALGNSCNRQTRSFEADVILKDVIQEALAIACDAASLSPGHQRKLDEWQIRNPEQLTCFLQARKLLAPIGDRPFEGTHCQGGSYAISNTMLSRCGAAGYFLDPSIWTGLPFAEDKMMGSACAAVGLECLDFSDFGEVFGVQATGLAYPPKILLDRGYSLIHSLKNDFRWSENEIRNFFREWRESTSGERHSHYDGRAKIAD